MDDVVNWANTNIGMLKDIATLVLPLLGVLVGARLATRSTEQNWRRTEGLKAYAALITAIINCTAYYDEQLHALRFKKRKSSDSYIHDPEYIAAVQEFYLILRKVTIATVAVRIFDRQFEHKYISRLSVEYERLSDTVDSVSTSESDWLAADEGLTNLGAELIAYAHFNLARPKDVIIRLR